jgi:hypothetical protein
LGFGKLIGLNNEWIKSFLYADEDQTLLAHRGSYKTTSLSIAIALFMILFPNTNIIFIRKTDTDVTEIINQVLKILESEIFKYFVENIYGKPFTILKSNASEITTDLMTNSRGAVQLLGLGIKASLTGKHCDLLITDDIVNMKDRISRAERDYTKQVYQELQNIKNRDGRIINTGTTWHKDDATILMPNKKIYDCYSTGLMTREQIEEQRKAMTPSLFSANYELKHIASETALFQTPANFYKGEDKPELLYNGMAHIDAAYGGDDGSAMTIIKKDGGYFFVLGKLRKTHVDNCLSEYLQIKNHYRCGIVYVEENADKGYLKKDIILKKDIAKGYHESMNKYIKISTYLKKYWDKLIFLKETDPDYINEIMDYTEDAEHDDAPDSCASAIRQIAGNRGWEFAK